MSANGTPSDSENKQRALDALEAPPLSRGLYVELPPLPFDGQYMSASTDSQYAFGAGLEDEIVYRCATAVEETVAPSFFDQFEQPALGDKLDLSNLSLLDSVAPSFLSAPVPLLPIMHDNTYFLSTASPSLILDSVSLALQSKPEVAFTTVPQKYKIKGTFCPKRSGLVIHFRVYVFQRANDYLVEFQRRAGCTVSFRHFFNDMISVISSLDRNVVSSSTSTPLQCPVEDTWCNEQASAALLPQLFEMATSEYSDVSLQGLRPLAALSQLNTVQTELVQHSSALLEVACKALQGQDLEVAHCVALTLANLCARPEMQNAFETSSAELLLDEMFNLLDCPKQIVQTRREIADALRVVGTAHPSLLKKDSYISVLRSASCCSDSCIRASVSELLATVGC